MQNVQPTSKLQAAIATLLETVTSVQRAVDNLNPVLVQLCLQEPQDTGEHFQLIRQFVSEANHAISQLGRSVRYLERHDLIAGHTAVMDGWDILTQAMYVLETSCPAVTPISPNLAGLLNNALAVVVAAMIPLSDAFYSLLRKLPLDTNRCPGWWSCRRPRVPALQTLKLSSDPAQPTSK